MKYTIENLADFLETQLSLSENGITRENAIEALTEYQQDNLDFASEAAFDLYVESGNPIVTPTGKNGKTTLADIRRAIGTASKSVKDPTDWDSAVAKKMAEENNLTGEDFPMESRTGRTLKTRTNFKKVSVRDVRKKLGVEKGANAFSSPGVSEYAKENGFSPSDFDHIRGRRIKKCDIEELIAQMIPDETE